jgi:dolichol kinase
MMPEIRRKLVHASGIVIIFLILLIGKLWTSLLLLAATAVMLAIGEYRKNKEKYKIIRSKKIDEFEESMEKVFKEHERPKQLPFKGAIEFLFGCFLVTFIFPPLIAMASVAVLSLADALSTLIGMYFGKHRLPVNKKKTYEGSTAFLLTAIFALVFFTSPSKAIIVAIFATFAEMLPYIDDNITVPITVALLLSIMG